MKSFNEKICLGTVQFGQPYGVANEFGQVVCDDEIKSILNLCREHGIFRLDTSPLYSKSEQKLGQCRMDDFLVGTKLPEVHKSEDVGISIQRSLKTLGIEKLDYVMFHRPDVLLGPHGNDLYQSLIEQKDQGKVDKIGVSVYEINELLNLIENFDFSIIQCPVNLLNLDFVDNKMLEIYRERKIEIQARSLFLQGLLLMPISKVPSPLKDLIPYIENLKSESSQLGMTPLEYILSAMNSVLVDQMVIGVQSSAQLNEIINSQIKEVTFDPSLFSCPNKCLVNPHRWFR